MKKKILAASLFCIYVCLSCQTGYQESKEGPHTDTTGVENLIQVPSMKCYETISRGDTFKLNIEVYSDIVAGQLDYLYHNHMRVLGQIQGIRYGDTLIADYIYTENGKKNARQVAFLLEDVFATEGHGPMEAINGKNYFTDKTKITFDKGTRFLRQDCDNPESSTFSSLAGIWELSFIDDIRIPLDSLYPVKKPHLLFTAGIRDQFSGHTSCNNLRGMFRENGKSFSFNEKMAMTEMYCEGDGELTFINKLGKVDAYAIQNEELTFFQNGTVIMRFTRK